MRTPTDRCQAVDIVRMYAMLAMLFTHAASKAGASVRVAQAWHGPDPSLSPLATAIGLLFHMATPAFALLTGVSLAFFVVARQRKRRPAAEIDGYLLRRGALLLGLALVVDSFLLDPLRWTFDPSILGMFALNLWLLIPLRRLSTAGLFLTAAGVAVASQSYLFWRGCPENPSVIEALILTTRGAGGGMIFPALPWLPVILVGFAAGRLVAEGRVSLERLALRMVPSLLGLWGLLLVSGLPVPFRKFPPSIDYQLPYLAFAFLLLALHARFRQPEGWWFYRRFVVLGRCALLFYLLHSRFVLHGLVVLLGRLHLREQLPAPATAVLVSLLALAILVPVCSLVLAWNAWRRSPVTAPAPSAAPASPQPSPG